MSESDFADANVGGADVTKELRRTRWKESISAAKIASALGSEKGTLETAPESSDEPGDAAPREGYSSDNGAPMQTLLEEIREKGEMPSIAKDMSSAERR